MQVVRGEGGQLVTTAHGSRAINEDVVVLPNLARCGSARNVFTIVAIEVSPFIHVLGRSDDVVAYILCIIRRIHDVLAGIYRGVVGIEEAGVQVDVAVLQLAFFGVGRQRCWCAFPICTVVLRLQQLSTGLPGVRRAGIRLQFFTHLSPSEVLELVVGEHTVGVRGQRTAHVVHRAVFLEAHTRPGETDTVGSIRIHASFHQFGHPIEATAQVAVGVPSTLSLSVSIILHQSEVGRQRNEFTLCIVRIRLRGEVVISTSSKQGRQCHCK